MDVKHVLGWTVDVRCVRIGWTVDVRVYVGMDSGYCGVL